MLQRRWHCPSSTALALLALCSILEVNCFVVHSSRYLPINRLATKIAMTDGQFTSTMRYVEGIREIVDNYDVFLLDMWGVMHDGSKPYDGVLEVVKKLRAAGKELIILSNSSKRKDNSERMLTKLGFDPNDFSQIITSGEVAYEMLRREEHSLGLEPWDMLMEIPVEESKVFILGSGDGDVEYCASCGWTAAPVSEASLVLARGTFTVNDGSTCINKNDDPRGYDLALAQSLAQAATLSLPMLVSNPDKVRPDVGRPPMPGKIGDDYERTLGPNSDRLVRRVGKPFPDVYKIALRGVFDRSRVCMVGDALETDIVGGCQVDISTIWVLLDGIHSPDVKRETSLGEEAGAIAESFNMKSGTYAKGREVLPTVVMPHFRW